MDEALDILTKTPLIDGHNDWPHLIRGFYDSKIETPRFDAKSSLAGHVDLKRLLQGKSGGVFLSAYIDCPAGNQQNDFSAEVHYEAVHDTLQQIDLIHRLISKYSAHLFLAETASSILEGFRGGRIACMVGVEGLHQIGNSASILRMYYRLGVRYVTLTHNWANAYADSVTAEAVHGGLSAAGHEMLQEMNRIGMQVYKVPCFWGGSLIIIPYRLVDLSHASEETAKMVLRASKAPIAFTHSSTKHICDHRRNVSDECLDMLKVNGGIIMIAFAPSMTHIDPSIASVEHVVDHIMYVGSRIGYQHIGIGTDFDGMEKSVQGLEDVSRYPALVEALLNRGVPRSDIEDIVGLNIIRVLEEVERAAMKISASAVPLEDEVKQLWNDDIRNYVRSVYPNCG